MGAVAGRVRNALQTVMMFTDSNAFKDLTGRYGFTVVEVRFADCSTAPPTHWRCSNYHRFPQAPDSL